MRLYILTETETKRTYERGSRKCYNEQIAYVVLSSVCELLFNRIAQIKVPFLVESQTSQVKIDYNCKIFVIESRSNMQHL